MPEIDFGLQKERFGDDLQKARLDALMCFPKSEDRRRAFLQLCHTRVEERLLSGLDSVDLRLRSQTPYPYDA